jgi:DNA-binding response OmpR family regulator
MEVKTVRNLAAFEQGLAITGEEQPNLVIVNFSIQGVDWEAAIRQASAQGYPVLAFGSHMDLEAHARARQAGASRVVANSRFTSDMPGTVQRLLNDPVSGATEEAESAGAE